MTLLKDINLGSKIVIQVACKLVIKMFATLIICSHWMRIKIITLHVGSFITFHFYTILQPSNNAVCLIYISNELVTLSIGGAYCKSLICGFGKIRGKLDSVGWLNKCLEAGNCIISPAELQKCLKLSFVCDWTDRLIAKHPSHQYLFNPWLLSLRVNPRSCEVVLLILKDIVRQAHENILSPGLLQTESLQAVYQCIQFCEGKWRWKGLSQDYFMHMAYRTLREEWEKRGHKNCVLEILQVTIRIQGDRLSKFL